MDITSAVNICVPFTAGWELFSPSPYLDSGGYAIGYGNHYYEDGSPVTADDDPIDQPTAMALLTFYVSQVAGTIAPMFSSQPSDNMLAACTDLAYNWGTGNFQNSQLLKLINAGSDQGTITAQWQVTATTSQGQPNSDLVSRRAAEAGLAYSGAGNLPILLLAALAIFLVIMFTKRKTR